MVGVASRTIFFVFCIFVNVFIYSHTGIIVAVHVLCIHTLAFSGLFQTSYLKSY